MRKLFGNSSRGASGGRYVAGKQAERRSAPVQPDVQRPESDEDEIPLLRDYANREAAQHGPETEKDDNPLLQQYLKRPPLAQAMPQEWHQAPAQPQQRPAQQARPAAQQPQSRPAPQPAQSVPAPRAPRAEAPRPRREEVRDEDLTRDLPRTDAEAPRSGMNGKTRGLILLLASIALFLGSVAMCLALLGRTTAVAPSGGDNKSGGGTSVRVETDAQTGQSIEMDVPDASGHEGIYNILLVGTDGDSTRTDTLLIANLNTKEHTVSLMSIPRDTYITGNYVIPKINSVYSAAGQGDRGIRALTDKIRETLAIAVDGYVLVDLQGFEKTIDMVGGVEFDIPTDLQYDDDDENIHVDLKAGRQLLDGAHALQLCRYRSGAADMDIERAATQQEFLRALARKLALSATLAKVKDYAELFATYVRTDLTVGNLIYLGSELMQCDFNAMYTVTLPGEAVEIKGGDYYQLDPDGVLKILNEHFNPTSEEYGKYDINIRQKTDIQRGDGTVTRDTTATTPTKSTQPRQEPTEPTQDTATEPTGDPTEPTEGPTDETQDPTEGPTEGPTEAPTEAPTEVPTEAPTAAPETAE